MNDLSPDSRPRLNPTFRLQWEEAQQSFVLLYPEGMVKLNGSAAEILKRCDGERRVSELVTQLEEAFGQTGLEQDVCGLLAAAIDRGWVHV